MRKAVGLHQVTVVADAGMLTDANLKALEGNATCFIVGSRLRQLARFCGQPEARLMAAQIAEEAEGSPPRRAVGLRWPFASDRRLLREGCADRPQWPRPHMKSARALDDGRGP